jgi:lipopolysaccharide export system permease protein
LLRSFFPAFLMSLGVLLFVLLMQYFLRLFSFALMKGMPLVWILFCFARLLPYFLSIALPIAFLVSLLLTLGQLSETGEMMALRASGFSFREILSPFLAVSLLLALLLIYVNHKASPEGFHSFRKAYSRASAQISKVSFEPRTYSPVGDWRFFAESVSEGGDLGGVRLIKLRGGYKRLRVSARSGRAAIQAGHGVALELRDGTLQWPNDDTESITTARFGRYRLYIPFVDAKGLARDLDIQELNTLVLLERAASRRVEPSRRREYATEAALRSSGAAAPFVLFWIACPLGLSLERKSRTAGFGLSLLVMFAFYGLLALGVGLGRRSLALSAWAPWLPNACALAAGAALWRGRLSRA